MRCKIDRNNNSKWKDFQIYYVAIVLAQKVEMGLRVGRAGPVAVLSKVIYAPICLTHNPKASVQI